MKIKIEKDRCYPIHENENSEYIKYINNILTYIDKNDKFHMIRDIYKLSSYTGSFDNVESLYIDGECECGMTFKVPFYTIVFFCPVCLKKLEMSFLEDKIMNEIRYHALKCINFV